MSFLTFIFFDLISFGIKIILILITLLIFKDKIADYLLDKQFNKGFGKLKDNIMSINFDDLESDDSQNNEDSQPPKFF